ncbi:hypothetical protein MJO28_017943 [Puccinia striiformis f. sp. tritici]|uniref:Uncharacterized protein n=1 Tax=Puccinia striiformis TaxID=27350 RepID=A0A2S4UFE9_9BASI|nr:hypothetical protein Pst134EA_007317 [Puccinia striiformis f. sp. tritici]KAH9470053.1 hypothetical protein Pst134EA_007317 [Puccinia striiformis f. sp. tritici]KAI7932964.1 hypothetical protein MJO28_017943 [Puccinia striiformis f. sp. tritici]KAI7963794.1 hypothetical protein MJO29_004221 [Puccinia striiformis f. sp. tritici]POV95921.1 hypothetical protein PSTT_15934 [Puccinia striiformis]
MTGNSFRFQRPIEDECPRLMRPLERFVASVPVQTSSTLSKQPKPSFSSLNSVGNSPQPSHPSPIEMPLSPYKQISSGQTLPLTDQPDYEEQLCHTDWSSSINQLASTAQPLSTVQLSSSDQPYLTVQFSSSNQSVSANQPISAHQPYSTVQFSLSNQSVSANQPVSAHQPASADQSVSADQPVAANQFVSANQPVTTYQSVSADQLASANQPVSANQTLLIGSHTVAQPTQQEQVLISSFNTVFLNNPSRQGEPETLNLTVSETCAVTDNTKSQASEKPAVAESCDLLSSVDSGLPIT